MKAKNIILMGLGLVAVAVVLRPEAELKASTMRVLDGAKRFVKNPVRVLDDCHESMRAQLRQMETELQKAEEKRNKYLEMANNLGQAVDDSKTDPSLQAISKFQPEQAETLPLPSV